MSRTSLLLIGLAAVTLAACQPPNPSGNMQFNSDSTTASQTGSSQTTTDLQLDTSTPENLQQKGTSMPQNGYKTIEDFEEIAATSATIKTSKGDITIELFREQAPLTTANFLQLAKDGFYDGIVFHRVIPDFMAQVGDPLTKDPSKKAIWGTGDPGYKIMDEFAPELKHDSPGIVSMANSGPNTGGSQFFITYEATPWLDNKHAVFGKVTEGMDVLTQISQGDTITGITLQ